MLVHIVGVLTQEQAASCRSALAGARWLDGRTSAGRTAAAVKQNDEVDLTDPAARKPIYTRVKTGAQKWAIEQTLVDPDGHCDWHARFEFDFEKASFEGLMRIQLLSIEAI